MINSFNNDNFIPVCSRLARKDADLKKIITAYDYPPLWSRVPSFATLVHIILEQQVSLASAKAAFLKLQEKTGHVEPAKILLLNDEEMKACYFSRQKIKYVRHLAEAVVTEQLTVEQLENMHDDEIRIQLKKIKGIGDWTVDVFLMMALHRCDHFPAADIALMKSIKEVKNLRADISKDEVLLIANQWKPYRTIAAFLLWHAYIKKRNLKF